MRKARVAALHKHLVGLAFSGGGIRSATFAVGILQGLAKLGLLRRVDYLSTVSGGGYAGSWLAAWIKREGSVTNVELQLAQNRVVNSRADRGGFLAKGVGDVVEEEPEPIYHLRAYSRFLAPRAGFLTADTWSIIATYGRNITINLLMLLPAAMILVLLVRALINLSNLAAPSGFYDPNIWVLILAIAAIGVVCLFRGLVTNASAVNDLRHSTLPRPPVDKEKLVNGVVLPLLAAIVLLSLSLMAVFWWLLPEWIARSPAGSWLRDGNLFRLLYEPRQGSGDRAVVPLVWSSESPVARLGWRILRTPQAVLSMALAAIAILGWLRRWSRWTLVVAAVIAPVVLTLLSQLTHEEAPSIQGSQLRSWAYFVAFPVTFGPLLAAAYIWAAVRDPALWNWRLVVAAFSSGAVGGLLLAVAMRFLYVLYHSFAAYGVDRPDLLATLAPPTCLLVLVAATVFHVGLLGHHIDEDEREWWAYLDAYLIIVAIGWLALFGTVVYLPLAVGMANSYVNEHYIQNGLLAGLVASWAGTTIAGVLAGRSSQTGSGEGNVRLETIAAVAPPVFLVGLFCMLGALATSILDAPGSWLGGLDAPPDRASTAGAYFHHLDQMPLVRIAGLGLCLVLAFKFVSRVVDVNLFSLNAMYANRLVRCYLGASRAMPRWCLRWGGHGRRFDRSEGGGAPTNVRPIPDVAPDAPCPEDAAERWRRANPVTGFDRRDDLPLDAFRIGESYLGPHLLVNTSLNLVSTTELAWSDRKSESFVLSPSHCGAKGTGYARVGPSGVAKDLTIGRAIAISGAAVDPNMNYHQSAALSAFLTIFNARLGYWIENPRPPARLARHRPEAVEDWTGKGPKYGGLLLSELLGKTDNKKEFVHLTDGGHFENTGVYELVRRRCRYIVACDANTDRTAADENLANLVRLVRIDFGIRIEVDTSPLMLDGDDTRLCRSHVVIGRVRYDDVDNNQVPGVLVYIRTSMTGDEPPDIRNYASVNREFPYTSSANQFFDESQFESYRALGDHVARSVFEDAKADAERLEKLWKEDDYDREFRRGNKRLFAALRRRWAESMPGRDSEFLESARGYLAIQEKLRTDEELRPLSVEVYPELGRYAGPVLVDGKAPDADGPGAGKADGDSRRAEIYAIAEMLQVMENTWLGLDLKSHPDAPISHGWWSVFRRWTATAAFHRNWPILRPEFSTEFARFVEARLGLVPAPPEVVDWRDGPDDEWARTLIEEFGREWPADRLGMGLEQMIVKAKEKGKAWLIRQGPSPAPGEDSASSVRGLVLIFAGSSLEPPSKDAPAAKAPEPPPSGDPAGEALELLVWIRRSHRGIGLATYAMEKKIEDVLEDLAKKHPIFVRYPRVEDQELQSMWKSFFSLYDFEPEKGATQDGPAQLRYSPPAWAVGKGRVGEDPPKASPT